MVRRCAIAGAALLLLDAGCGKVTADDADAGGADGAPGADAAPDIDAAPVAPNLVFTTSTTHTGALGGLGGADSICNQRASEAGLAGTYVAWLSTSTVAAPDRLAGASGWTRVDGQPFANTVDDMLAGRIFFPPELDEAGNRIGSQVWTATLANGQFDSANGDCGDWSFELDSQSALTGQSTGGFGRFTASIVFRCDLGSHLLCFGTDRAATVRAPADEGRRAFVSTTRFDGGEGIAAFDAACNDEASDAGLSGSFRAAIAEGTNPVASRYNLVGATWVRVDGVKLFDGPGDMNGDKGTLAPIQLTAGGTPVNDQVWTGASGFTNVNPNCADWTDAGTDGIVGVSSLSGISSVSFNGSSCASKFPVYCFEE